ncbi:MAG: hypothetical protein OXU20_39695 [Myxococcales bacterium]|nr:hypothetical protein [Myxococcales bacterium]
MTRPGAHRERATAFIRGRRPSRVGALCAAGWLACGLLGCDVPQQKLSIPEPPADHFLRDVYPVLLADCAFPACHGDRDRAFLVLGPGRTRLRPETDAYAPATADELALSYARARSMLLGPGGARRAPLLKKPLAVKAGGAGHAGDDPWGGAIYASKRDPRYEALFFWAIAMDDTTEEAEDASTGQGTARMTDGGQADVAAEGGK